MKQLIVLIATVVLGIAIAAMVLGFKDQAQAMGDTASGGLSRMATSYAAIMP